MHTRREELGLWGVPEARLAEVAIDRRTLVNLQNLADPDLKLPDGGLVPVKGLGLRS
jgi:hypothetical protein